MLKLLGFIYFLLCCIPLSCYKTSSETDESVPLVNENEVPPKYEDIN